jgi:antitoxin ParD1/3/4
MTLHVSLPKELEILVHQEVQTGMYSSASEVVREALRGFFGGVAGRELRDMSEIRAEITESLRRYQSGEDKAVDGEQFFEDMKIKYGLD